MIFYGRVINNYNYLQSAIGLNSIISMCVSSILPAPFVIRLFVYILTSLHVTSIAHYLHSLRINKCNFIQKKYSTQFEIKRLLLLLKDLNLNEKKEKQNYIIFVMIPNKGEISLVSGYYLYIKNKNMVFFQV